MAVWGTLLSATAKCPVINPYALHSNALNISKHVVINCSPKITSKVDSRVENLLNLIISITFFSCYMNKKQIYYVECPTKMFKTH